MIKLLITKLNEWYDTLPPTKRALFFFIVIFGSLTVAQYFAIINNNPWVLITWLIVFGLPRIIYKFGK
jgi:hypothetical protein